MTLPEAKAELEKFVKLKTTLRPAFVDVLLNAEVAPRWIPFTERELTAEEQEEHPDWCYIMECPLPDDGQEILVSDGKWVWQDAFHIDDGCYLDSDRELEGCAWMPLPEPYKEGEQNA